MFGLGAWEIGIIFAVLVLLFGPSRLPKLMHSVGSSITQFKRGVSGIESDMKDVEREVKNTVAEAEKVIRQS